MPIKSKQQLKMMFGAANGKKYGPSKKVAEEMLSKTSHSEKSQLMRGQRNK